MTKIRYFVREILPTCVGKPFSRDPILVAVGECAGGEGAGLHLVIPGYTKFAPGLHLVTPGLHLVTLGYTWFAPSFLFWQKWQNMRLELFYFLPRGGVQEKVERRYGKDVQLSAKVKVVQNYLKAGVHQNVHLNYLEAGVNITSSRVWRKSGAERRRERGRAVPARATASELEICRFFNKIFFDLQIC